MVTNDVRMLHVELDVVLLERSKLIPIIDLQKLFCVEEKNAPDKLEEKKLMKPFTHKELQERIRYSVCNKCGRNNCPGSYKKNTSCPKPSEAFIRGRKKRSRQAGRKEANNE